MTPARDRLRRVAVAALALAGGWLAPVAAADGGTWSGWLATEVRGFASGAGVPGQPDARESFSLAVRPEYRRDWHEGRDRFVFTGFARYDQQDDQRTHADVRELYWQTVGKRWQLSVGVREVFWGVTESRHLVNVINQTDLVEDLDGEDKLGQPMIDFALDRSWGTVRLFLLPGFRERTFPGNDGRVRTLPAVDPDGARYESASGREHVDWALRWSHAIGAFDLGVAHFSGTARDPLLLPAERPDGDRVLIPFYEQVERTSLDLQATRGGFLWKLEAVSEESRRGAYQAAVGGFEYTLVGAGGSAADVGILAEYLYDERGDRATTPFEDDVFVGARLTFNDPSDTNLLIGAIVDRGNGGTLFELEGSRRLTGGLKLNVTARGFIDLPADDFLAPLSHDDYLQMTITHFF